MKQIGRVEVPQEAFVAALRTDELTAMTAVLPTTTPPVAPLVDPGSFGVYVHVPFCLTRCHYCDFVTYTGMEGLRRPHAPRCWRRRPWRRPPSAWRRRRSPACSWGRDPDPAAAGRPRPAAGPAGGAAANRARGRRTPPPGRPPWRRRSRSARAPVRLRPHHRATRFGRLVAAGRLAEPGEDDLADRYDTTCATLAAAGYHHYEVSNWARDGWNEDALHRPAARFGPLEGERSGPEREGPAVVHTPRWIAPPDPVPCQPAQPDLLAAGAVPGAGGGGARVRRGCPAVERGRGAGVPAGRPRPAAADRRGGASRPGQARFEALALRLRTADGLEEGAARTLGVDPGGPQAQELRRAGLLAPERVCG